MLNWFPKDYNARHGNAGGAGVVITKTKKTLIVENIYRGAGVVSF